MEPNSSGGSRLGVVLLSGGLDSATTAAWALAAGYRLVALSVDYGQRHHAELAAARRVAKMLSIADHRCVAVDLRAIGGSALTADLPVPVAAAGQPDGTIPLTYVPARNTVLLSLALGLAEVTGAFDIFLGANAVDYSGYPDCRPEYLHQFETLANLATKAGVEGTGRFRVRAPLLDWPKARIIEEGTRLGVDFSQTVSCYQADVSGLACGVCDSCRIRKAGFAAAGLPDPTRYQP